MKKIGTLYREKIIERIAHNWLESKSGVFINFSKVSASHFNMLRNSLKRDKVLMLVSKNSLIKRALATVGTGSTDDFISGSTSVVFVNNENIVKVCKMLFDFSKENQGFVLKGALLDNKRMGYDELEKISKLPSRNILIAQAIAGIASPLTGFVVTLNNVLVKFLYLVEEIKNKKSNDG